MKITMDVATLRAIYDSAADVKDFLIEMDDVVIRPLLDDGEGGFNVDGGPYARDRAKYIRRALITLIEGNKAAIRNAMKNEIKADLDLIKSSADVPA